MPYIDVIIPTYNRAGFLKSALSSVLNQSFGYFQILVVDDCSEDNTEEVVRGFKDDKIIYIRHSINKGEGGSRNTGLRNANARYIAFLDDDDEWLPNKLELQVKLLDSSPPEVGCVYTGFLMVDKLTGRVLSERIPRKRGYVYGDMVMENVVGTSSTVLVKRECFEKVGVYDEGIPWGLDYDMWIRIAKEYHIEYIKDPLVKYNIHQGQLSNNLGLRINGLETMLQKYEQFFASDIRALSQYYFELGFLKRENGEPRKAGKAFWKALRLNPRNVKNYSSLLKILGLFVLGKRNFIELKRIKNRYSFLTFGLPNGKK